MIQVITFGLLCGKFILLAKPKSLSRSHSLLRSTRYSANGISNFKSAYALTGALSQANSQDIAITLNREVLGKLFLKVVINRCFTVKHKPQNFIVIDVIRGAHVVK